MGQAAVEWRRRLIAGVAAFILLGAGAATAATVFDLSQYKSPASARRATLPLPTGIAPTAAFVGMRAEPNDQGRLFVAALAPDAPAAAAGVRLGDLLAAVDGHPVSNPQAFANLIRGDRAGRRLKFSLLREGAPLDVFVECASLASAGKPTSRPAITDGSPAGREGESPFVRNRNPARMPSLIRKDVLRIAVVGIDFADVHHNPQITSEDWSEAFFSRLTYRDKNATGQRVFGSVNDFYQEISVGAMRVDGHVFDWVEVAGKRMDYYTAVGRSATQPVPALARGGAPYDARLLRDVLKGLSEREGWKALDVFDGVAFIYAGPPAVRHPGNVYWPHTSELIFRDRRLRYVIAYEGGRRMTNISLFCHETGHILGLPDLYGSRGALADAGGDPVGLGAWCLMSIQVGDGRPQHMSAWCKERLGWIAPAIVDPSVRQHLILAPIENSRTECFKVPLKADGSEYLLLENRRHIGFDASVPAEGLLIWRVANNRPRLIEAHGLTNLRAPWLNVRNIPYPTPRNDAYTPFTKPSSAGAEEGELPIYLTDIRRLEDGRIAFSIGYGFD